MSKSNASKDDEWIMVRIKRTTHQTLKLWGAIWQDMALLEMAKRGRGERDQPSLDAVINELVRRVEGHKERRKRSAVNRALKTLKDMETGPQDDTTVA